MARYIDVDKLKEDLEEARAAGMIDMYSCEQRECDFDEAIECVDIQPTADVQPVVYAKWVVDARDLRCRCSHCHYGIYAYQRSDFRYCYNCGARMGGDNI